MDGAALLNAIVSNPEEDTPALMLADWLQEHGAAELAVALRGAVCARPGRTVYLVSSGSYSDYGVQGVFSSKENAEKFISASKTYPRGNDFNDVEEYTLDFPIAPIDAGLTPFVVRMLQGGDQAVVERHAPWAAGPDRGHFVGHHPTAGSARTFVTFVWARDESHAVKIANEKRIALLAAPTPSAAPS